MDLTFGQKWESCKLFTDNPQAGSPTISVTGDTLTCFSILNDSSKASKFIQVRGGEVLTLKVWARITSGSTAGIAIDYPTSGDLRTIQEITGKDWKEYSVSAFIPPNCADDAYCIFQVGVFGRYSGTAEFKNPRISKTNAVIGTTQTIAMGLLFWDATDSNTLKIHTGFAHHGIYSYSYSTVAKELTIEIQKTQKIDPETIGGDTLLPMRPLFFGNTTADNGGATLNVKYDSYDFATGQLKAKFYNTSGVLVDVTTLLGSGSIYFNFKAEVN